MKEKKLFDKFPPIAKEQWEEKIKEDIKNILKISLDDKIIVGTRAFTINKMTTKLQSGETELELLSEPE